MFSPLQQILKFKLPKTLDVFQLDRPLVLKPLIPLPDDPTSIVLDYCRPNVSITSISEYESLFTIQTHDGQELQIKMPIGALHLPEIMYKDLILFNFAFWNDGILLFNCFTLDKMANYTEIEVPNGTDWELSFLDSNTMILKSTETIALNCMNQTYKII